MFQFLVLYAQTVFTKRCSIFHLSTFDDQAQTCDFFISLLSTGHSGVHFIDHSCMKQAEINIIEKRLLCCVSGKVKELVLYQLCVDSNESTRLL